MKKKQTVFISKTVHEEMKSFVTGYNNYKSVSNLIEHIFLIFIKDKIPFKYRKLDKEGDYVCVNVDKIILEKTIEYKSNSLAPNWQWIVESGFELLLNKNN